ncbi:MAG: SIMPL domain-containing protein [Pseudomonadota bacterium]
MFLKPIAGLALLALLATQAHAQSTLPTAGTLVIVPAQAEVTHANDEAILEFTVEEQDRDKTVAASRVNQKMKQGMEILRASDPQAVLQTHGYTSEAIYPARRTGPKALPMWRINHYVQLKTTNLVMLPKTVAAAQRLLALSDLQFGLTPATLRALDDERIAATYRNLNERATAIALAMGRKLSDATLETLDFDGTARNRDFEVRMPDKSIGARATSYRNAPASVPEPSFEPGATTLQMQLLGKLRFK